MATYMCGKCGSSISPRKSKGRFVVSGETIYAYCGRCKVVNKAGDNASA